jgi:regulator of sigma E protease
MLYPLAFVVLIGVLITVHELGHFIVAKLAGVRVLVFSIGFGPRLFGFKKGETDYRLSLFPLGGYVRMYGDDLSEDVPPEERHRAFLYKPFLPKSAISAAGPLANLVLPVFLFLLLFVGKETVPDAVVGTVVPGEPAAAAGILPGDRITHVSGAPVSVFSEVANIVEGKPGVPLTLTVQRNVGAAEQTLQIAVTPRTAKAPTPLDAERKVGRLGLLAVKELPIVVVAAESPAAKAGLKSQDRITHVNGERTPTRDALLAALDARAAEAWTLNVTRKDAPAPLSITIGVEEASVPPISDDRFAVTSEEMSTPALLATLDETRAAVGEAARTRALRRGLSPVDGLVTYVAEGTAAEAKRLDVGAERIVAVDGKPLRTPSDLEAALQSAPDVIHVIGLLGDDKVGKPAARVIAFRMGPPPQRQLKSMRVLGAAIGAAYGDPLTVERNVSVGEAFTRGIHETKVLVVEVIRGFGLLFSGRVGLESLGGPITIFNLAGQAASIDSSTYIRLMGLISVNLAILNLLPIPILDGGHLLLFSIEAVQRRRLTIETRMKATKIGLVFVGLMMIIAVGNDLLGLFQ